MLEEMSVTDQILSNTDNKKSNIGSVMTSIIGDITAKHGFTNDLHKYKSLLIYKIEKHLKINFFNLKFN